MKMTKPKTPRTFSVMVVDRCDVIDDIFFPNTTVLFGDLPFPYGIPI